MGLNPFKDANLNDLQENIIKLFFRYFGNMLKMIKRVVKNIRKKGNEKVTLMFIPHSEKRIINFHISIFTITFIMIVLFTITAVTSVLIVNHTSTIKEVSKLKIYGADSKIQIQHYRKEINKLYDIFQKFKPELTYLYSLTPNNYDDSLWAKGGASSSENVAAQEESSLSPSVEVLNIEEMNQELETTKKVLQDIKKFLNTRQNIIENTPSLWPVNGSIVSTFGNRTSPFSFKKEFYQGIDIAAFPGAEIHATAPGTVQSIEWDAFLGLTITIKHKYGFFTRYSHCQRVVVDIEQKVKKGEVIGFVGKTGKAARHICHYQIKIGTDFVDPMPYLNKILYK